LPPPAIEIARDLKRPLERELKFGARQAQAGLRVQVRADW
jgi:hypothetical protein